MSTEPKLEPEKIAVEQGNGSSEAPSVVSDELFANPTGINEKALVRRLDLKLLPPLTLLYLLSFLDRSNGQSPVFICPFVEGGVLILMAVGNAKLEGLATDLHITGNQYLFTLTIYFIGYVSLEQLQRGEWRVVLTMERSSSKFPATLSSNVPHQSSGSQP